MFKTILGSAQVNSGENTEINKNHMSSFGWKLCSFEVLWTFEVFNLEMKSNFHRTVYMDINPNWIISVYIRSTILIVWVIKYIKRESRSSNHGMNWVILFGNSSSHTISQTKTMACQNLFIRSLMLIATSLTYSQQFNEISMSQ